METPIPINQEVNIQLPLNSYDPPQLDILEFAVEKGFAASAEGWNPDTW